ncbi:MAG: hypothetical protein QOG53_2694 [Frankiales bacterium]|jgi:hypothetical protein|nr:hypothetical protein [Frankiales bacterium]
MKAIAAAAVLVLVPIAACGPAQTSQARSVNPTVPASASPSAAPTVKPAAHDHEEEPRRPFSCPAGNAKYSPHFNTPQGAMRYLARAWNNNDLKRLCHVTNPDARAELNGMHVHATNLRLNHCAKLPAGDYRCFFDHDFPKGVKVTERGLAEFRVGPARVPGWYMTIFEECN